MGENKTVTVGSARVTCDMVLQTMSNQTQDILGPRRLPNIVSDL